MPVLGFPIHLYHIVRVTPGYRSQPSCRLCLVVNKEVAERSGEKYKEREVRLARGDRRWEIGDVQCPLSALPCSAIAGQGKIIILLGSPNDIRSVPYPGGERR